MSVQVSFTQKHKRQKKRFDNFKTVVVTIAAIIFAAIFLLPTILTFTNSFMSAAEISANYGSVFATTEKGGKVFISKTVNLKFIPDMVTFNQYFTVLFKSPEYLFKFWNSVIYVGPIVVIQLLIATLASYGFARYSGKLKNAIFFAYIIMMLMPYQVTLVPNFLVSRAIGIYGTRWAIWLPGMFSPFAVYLLTKFMKRIPTEVMEAASIDGANEWYIFSRVCMPLCKGGIASIAILVFFDYWNMVEQPLILLPDADMHPLSVFLSKINAGEISLAFAVAVIYLVPPLLIFLYGEDYLVEGISYQGGIKG
ncbi:MAG: carbohydrate ABC transporter permease [Butyrivibrio sp.]|nr:carbohydrate ABC transporter permease [Butyrivibrio sp.]